MSAVAMEVFAFFGTPEFFLIMAKMKNPNHYIRAILTYQTAVYIVYLTVGVMIYWFCGSYVSSQDLSSVGPLWKRGCYGVAIPGPLVTGMLVSHVSSLECTP
jgi:hypothetical protein